MKTKKIVAGIVAVACLVVIVGAQLYLMQTPAGKQGLREIHQVLRDTPAGIFYPIFIVFALVTLGPVTLLLFGHKKWALSASKRSVLRAKKVALSMYRVDGPIMLKEGSAVMCFRHLSWSHLGFVLPVRPGHPDIERFCRLRDGDEVAFDPLEECLECAIEHELCGFLRIKTINGR